ncbi:MAG: T9SS type A sorting domain-containing protein [Bacteroidetes bacterium]|nr:T9SS type A sorting domain-containing protein [Bacteroidota bacterium]
MKNNLLLYLMLLLAVMPFAERLQAQISFTDNSNLLGTTSGFSYEDCAVDMNGDFLDDVVRVTGNGMYIDYQQIDGSFTQSFFAIDFENVPSWSLCAGDIDGNGYNDLLFGDGNRVSFVYANADGTAYTEDDRPEYIFCQRSTMADIDNDGHLDAFVCHDVDQSHPYRNDGNGYLELDQTLIETIDQPGNYAAIWCDYDNDNDIDLYVTKCRGGAPPGDPTRTNRLYQNNGDGTYTEVAEAANMDDNSQSWATVFEDFDNDGDFDAFIVNHDFTNLLMRNEGDGTFTNVIGASGIDEFDLGAWENASGDFNNDGYVDILSELGKEIYFGNGDLTFTSQDLPFDDGGIGDFNNDGFLDVIKSNALWLNDGNDHNWVKISTVGTFSNLNGIGARVEIHGDWGIQIREVRSGQSFSPMSTLNVHFGLGDATSIDQIVVKWPSGFETVVENPAINTAHVITEVGCLLPATVLSVDGSTQLCPGESINISAPEGFTYAWSTEEDTQSILVNEPGNYSVTLTDADGCVSLSNIVQVMNVVEVYPTIDAQSSLIFCKGESVMLTSSGGPNLEWSNGQTSENIEVFESGIYSVSVDPVCPGDALLSNELEVVVLESAEPELLAVMPNGDQTFTLTAAGENLSWYDAESGGNLLGTGDSYVTPPLSDETTYWVESTSEYPGELQEGGKEDLTGNGGLPASGGYSLFDSWEPFTLISVDVFVPQNAAEGTRTVQLTDANGIVLEEKVFELEQGQHQLDLNFAVPVGVDLSLRCPEANLFRNSGSVSYPYPIGDVGELKTSSFGTGYYYYFYNWKIQKESFSCTSYRIPATVTFSGTDELAAYGSLELFPNPATDEVILSFEAETAYPAEVQVLDVMGRVLIQRQIDMLQSGENQIRLAVDHLPAGIYETRFIIEGKQAVRKLIVE